MWEPAGKPLDREALGTLEPSEILYDYGAEPLTFLARDRDGELLLVHSLSASDRISRYVASAIDERILDDLRAGHIDLRTAIRQPRCWIADVAEDASLRAVWRVDFASIPERVLPRPGAMLNPEHDPLFRIRLIGPGVGPGKTTASDVRMAAQAAETGLRGLARVVLNAKRSAGRVPRDIQRLSDLPYQAARAASFEIAFARPRDRFAAMDAEVFEDMARLLDRGLKALRANDDDLGPVEGLDAEQTAELFEAIRALTPPTLGGVDRVEVGGGLVDGRSGPKVLTRDDRVRSGHRIAALRWAAEVGPPFRVVGKVEEADQGRLSFTLRHLEPPGYGDLAEIPFWFREILYDDVMDAFNSPDPVAIVGEKVGARFEAIQIRAVDAPSE